MLNKYKSKTVKNIFKFSLMRKTMILNEVNKVIILRRYGQLKVSSCFRWQTEDDAVS